MKTLFTYLTVSFMTFGLHAQGGISPSDVIYLKNGEQRKGEVLTDLQFNKSGMIILEWGDPYPSTERFDIEEIARIETRDGKLYEPEVLSKEGIIVLMQKLFIGEKSLGQHRDRFYLLDQERTLRLEIVEKLKVIDGQTKTFRIDSYKQLLNSSMGNACEGEVSQRIEKTNLNASSLVRLFELYHECNGLEFTSMINTQIAYRWTFNFIAGPSFLRNSGFLNHSSPVKHPFGMGFNAKYLLNWHINSNNLDFFISTGIDVGTYESQFTNVRNVVSGAIGGATQTTVLRYTVNMVRVPLVLNSNFYGNKHFKLYGGAGFNYAFLARTSQESAFQTGPFGAILAKAGAIIRSKEKLNFLFEVQMDQGLDYGYFVVGQSFTYFQARIYSFNLGIRI